MTGSNILDEARMSMDKASIDPATLDLIYEVTRQGPPNQFREAETLDAKIVQIFAAASVVLGLAAVAGDMVIGFLVLAVIAYVAVAGATLWGIWIRKTKRPFHSDTLLEDFWKDSAADVRYALAYELPEMYSHNQRIIDDKATAAKLAIIATAVEVAAVGGMVIWAAA